MAPATTGIVAILALLALAAAAAPDGKEPRVVFEFRFQDVAGPAPRHVDRAEGAEPFEGRAP